MSICYPHQVTMSDSEFEKAVQAGNTGDIEALYEIIQGNPYVLECIDRVPYIHTPLHSAAYNGRLAFVLEMINSKPSFARKLNQAGFSPMHLALQTGKDLIVLQLLKFDKDLVLVKGKEGMTPLHQAVQIGNLDILIKFLQAFPEAIQDVTVQGESAFHIALKNDQIKAFKVLVGWLRRSCHKAAQSWEKELLLGEDFEGNTVLDIAVTQSKPSEEVVEVVKLLLENFSHDQINAKNSTLDALKNQKDKIKSEIYDMLSNAGLIPSKTKQRRNSVGGLIRSLFVEKPDSSASIGSLTSNMSYHSKFKTAIARARSGISEATSNIFLVVTVLIVTATYGASSNPPKEPKENGNGSETGSTGSFFESSGSPLGLELRDVYSLFWLYNTLTFWASVWLTAFLLPRRSSICLFLLATLSLFGSCYMLLIVAVSTNLASYFGHFSPFNWYYTICVVNYILSTSLAFMIAYRIARFVCLKLAKSRRVLLCLILLVSFLLVVICILFPAMLFSEIMWRSVLPAVYSVPASATATAPAEAPMAILN